MSPTSIAERMCLNPIADPEFAMLDWDMRDQVNRRLDALREACVCAATIRTAVQEFAVRAGLPYGTARRIWDNILRDGWRGALDGRKRKNAGQSIKRRTAFIQFMKELVEKNGRSCRAAVQDLYTLWRAGHDIPGYPEFNGHPPAGPAGIPEGWTYATLAKFFPSKPVRTLARIGRAAFQADTTSLWTTRAGLHCGEVYQFDDVLHDNLVYRGKQAIRLMELGCIDVASSKRVLWGTCPQVKGPDGKMGLKERYMQWLVIGVLTEVGFYEGGVSLIVEHGTAAIREPFEKALHDLSKGKIKVERSGIQDKPALLGYWAGAGGGNPRMKALLESLHNYYHNRLGLLPAQTGGNARLNKPEEQTAILKYCAHLAKEFDNVSPAVVDELLGKLAIPILTDVQFVQFLFKLYQVIDGRHEHSLEGWEKNGWIKTRWRLSGDDGWHDEEDLAGLDEDRMKHWQAMVRKDPSLCRPMRLSPNEVWMRRDGMKKLPQHAIPIMLGPQGGREVTVRDGRIEYHDLEIDPDGLRFSGLAEDAWAHQVLLKEREKYLAYLNPFRPDKLLICDAGGRFIGAALRIERAPRIDHAAVMKAVGQDAGRQTAMMKDYRDRHEGDAVAHQAMLADNELVLQGAKKLRAVRTPTRAELNDIFGPKEQPHEEEKGAEQDGAGLEELYGSANERE